MIALIKLLSFALTESESHLEQFQVLCLTELYFVRYLGELTEEFVIVRKQRKCFIPASGIYMILCELLLLIKLESEKVLVVFCGLVSWIDLQGMEGVGADAAEGIVGHYCARRRNGLPHYVGL